MITCIDDIDVLWTELESDPERDLKIRESLKQIPNFDLLLKRWESAWKMRNWIMEKKKNLSERIKKDVEIDYKKKKEEADKNQPSASSGPDTPAVDQPPAAISVDEVELIDTSSKPKEEKKEEAKVDGNGLTEADKDEIERIADEKFNNEL